MDLAPLLDELPPERRLALAYAPGPARADILAVFLLDLRLSRLVGQGREPLLTQLRLAWWRDRLGEAPGGFHHDEPVLALLAPWGDRRGALVALVDGWEALLAEPPIPDAAIQAFAKGRGAAFAALAERLGAGPFAAAAERFGRNWALADLAAKTSDADEASRVRAIAAGQDWSPAKLPRTLRPLAVLHGLARRKQGAGPLLGSFGDTICAMRLGLFGR